MARLTAPLTIGLADPGLTPMLRAGLGGLAASVRAMARATDKSRAWPTPVRVGPGRVVVTPRSVEIEWGLAPPLETLRALFEASFPIDEHGIIDLPGTYDRETPPGVELSAALQRALKSTFLQHGKSTRKQGRSRTWTIEVDDVPAFVSFQPYRAFLHQHAFRAVATALRTGEAAPLAGWAYPGAVARHIAIDAAGPRYSAGHALCACFAIVGCLSYTVSLASGGALVIPVPADLVRFARTRPRLTPRLVQDASVPGVSDALLAIHLALRLDQVASREGAIGSVHGVQFKTVPWARQLKSRHRALSAGAYTEAELDRYDRMRKALPNRLRVRKHDAEVFGTSGALRAFIAENLARHARWFDGFATATDGSPENRFVHYDRERHNLGALFTQEKKGLVVMLDELEPAEHALVRAVHCALRNRFGAIAQETKGSPAIRKSRWQGERDRWRYAFAGSKNAEQIRAALADMWSRAGNNPVLQEHWSQILPLLRPAQWRAARDLALVGLASYRGAREDTTGVSDGGE